MYSQKNSEYYIIAKTLPGLEGVLAEELEAINARDIRQGRRMVSFFGDDAILYAANLQCRTAVRVIKPVEKFEIDGEKSFYKALFKVNWEKYLNVNQTFNINTTVFSPHFSNSQFAMHRCKDAIVDWFRANAGMRPNVEPKEADITFDLHISKNHVTLSLDSSGESLHKRGYRINGWKAPLNEVLAAGMLKLSGWTADKPLYDLMSGSGTLAIEAALSACNYPANGRRRQFSFMNWPSYNESTWQEVKEKAFAKLSMPEPQILANDLAEPAQRIAQENAIAAGVEDFIEFKTGDFRDVMPTSDEGFVIVNPPYGERIDVSDLEKLYADLADHFKQNFAGHTAWIISANTDGLKRFGLRSSRKITLFNGSLETRFVRFDLYKGSRKEKKS